MLPEHNNVEHRNRDNVGHLRASNEQRAPVRRSRAELNDPQARTADVLEKNRRQRSSQ